MSLHFKIRPVCLPAIRSAASLSTLIAPAMRQRGTEVSETEMRGDTLSIAYDLI